MTGSRQPPAPAGSMLAAAHRFLEHTITASDWTRLQTTALASRAPQDAVQTLVRDVIEQQTAWKFWPATRLLRYITDTLAELDGDLLRTGGSLAALTPREACNMAYALLLAARREPEDRDQFIDDLHYPGDPDAEALAQVRAMQAAQAAQQAAKETSSG
jgi:hypothetical protein